MLASYTVVWWLSGPYLPRFNAQTVHGFFIFFYLIKVVRHRILVKEGLRVCVGICFPSSNPNLEDQRLSFIMPLSLNQSSKVEPTHQGLGTNIALAVIETYKPYHLPKVTSPEWRPISPPIENKLLWAVITIANELVFATCLINVVPIIQVI